MHRKMCMFAHFSVHKLSSAVKINTICKIVEPKKIFAGRSLWWEMFFKQGDTEIWITHFFHKTVFFQIRIPPEHFGTLFETRMINRNQIFIANIS